MPEEPIRFAEIRLQVLEPACYGQIQSVTHPDAASSSGFFAGYVIGSIVGEAS